VFGGEEELFGDFQDEFVAEKLFLSD